MTPPFLPLSDMPLSEVIGIVGFALYVTNYSLLTFHKLHSHDMLYFAINLVAASMVLFSLSATFNLASALIQGFWVIISITALLVRLRRKLRQKDLQTTLADSHDLIAETVHVYDEPNHDTPAFIRQRPVAL